MDIGQARTFLAIAPHGSLLEAAQWLHLTESTVSRRIKNLESELGAPLFIRNRAALANSGRKRVVARFSVTRTRWVRTSPNEVFATFRMEEASTDPPVKACA